MTKQEAKTIALEKLRYYETHPLISREWENMPDHLIEKITSFHNHCPLCELFCVKNPEDGKHCGGCPLTPPTCNDYSDTALQNNIAILEAWEMA